MSSTVLYLAIVAVWAVVLVPMWLRRDNNDGLSRLLHRRTPEAEELADPEPEPLPAPLRRPGRAAVIARRRRRTTGLTLTLVAAVATVLAGLAPWWVALPPLGLLAGHLALLRVAVEMDIARRQAAAEHRARLRHHAPSEEEEPEHAEIIELAPRTLEVFDQYADDRRAVGD